MDCVCGVAAEDIQDDISGNTLCGNCGRLKEDKQIVSSVRSFQNSLISTIRMLVDSSVTKMENIPESKPVKFFYEVWGTSRDSDELRLSKAYRLISNIANSLNLPKFIEEVVNHD